MRNERSEISIIKKILKDDYGIDVKDHKSSLTESDIKRSWKAWVENRANVFVLCGLPKDVYCHIIADNVVSDLREREDKSYS